MQLPFDLRIDNFFEGALASLANASAKHHQARYLVTERAKAETKLDNCVLN